jgi:agmatine deiminase
MTIRIPAEWEPHACCWMAWAVHAEWRNQISVVKDELSVVVRTIAQYEPVRLLAPQSELAEARARFSGGNIEIIEAPVDDIWMRDIAPTFALRGNDVVAIDWNFNSWGGTAHRPARPGDRLARLAESIFGVARVSVPFVGEGGAFITDGQGTLMTTRSCLLNSNRNRLDEGRQRFIEKELAELGIRVVIWLDGDPSEPITSGHIDGYVMFVAPATVLVETIEDEQCEPPLWREHDLMTIGRTRDAAGRKIKLTRVAAPLKRYWKFRGPYWAPCYLNAYIANGGVITASFDDTERDDAARRAIAQAFPDREVVMLRIDNITNGGGGMHCLTQPMPAAKEVISSRSRLRESSRNSLQSEYSARG